MTDPLYWYAVRYRILLLASWALCAASGPVALAQQPAAAERKVLQVGPGRALERPSDAARVASDGDIVEIDAAEYAGDAALWTQNDLTLRGAGGRARLRAAGAHAEGKAIWVIRGRNTLVENIEFSGAAVRNLNGAGIRSEGAGLTVRFCYFHGNEMGILSGVNPESDIVIEYSEFARNGNPERHNHNIYIGEARSFTLRFSYVHHAIVGHDVKSRARANYILYNRIGDEADGRSSYGIDLPNGGLSYVIGNLVQQGPATENDALLAYGTEGLKHPINELYVVNNTLVNDLPQRGRFIFGREGTVVAVNNLLAGAGTIFAGAGTATLRNNYWVSRADFVAPEQFDYRLRAGSAAIGSGVDPGVAHGMVLKPASQYVHRADGRARTGPLLDVGALSY